MNGITVNGTRTKLFVENIKCGGCANTISKALGKLGYTNVTVDPEQSTIEMDSPKDASEISGAVEKLRGLGYPLIETEEGLRAAALKARSYLSCAIGKFSESDDKH